MAGANGNWGDRQGPPNGPGSPGNGQQGGPDFVGPGNQRQGAQSGSYPAGNPSAAGPSGPNGPGGPNGPMGFTGGPSGPGGPPFAWNQQQNPQWQPGKKKSNGLVIGIVVGVLLLALVAGGGWFVYSSIKARELAEADAEAVSAAKSAISAIASVDLDDADRIKTAEQRYNEVREEVRGQVSNYSTLTKAKGEFQDQQEQLESVQGIVDAWAAAPECATGYEAAEAVEPLNPSQLERLKGYEELYAAVDKCRADEEAAAEKERQQKEKEEQEKQAAEETRRKNLFKVSNYWFEKSGEGPAKGCLFAVTPEFTNLSKTETFQSVVIDVSFYNPDGSTATDMSGNSSQRLTISKAVAPGALHRSTVATVNYDCAIDLVRIERVELTYASGGKDELYPGEIQYGAQWTNS